MMARLKKLWRREVGALLLFGLVASGGVAFLNHRQAAHVVVSADTPAGPLGSAEGPEDPILTPDVRQPDVPEATTVPPPTSASPTPTPAREGPPTPTSSTSSQPPTARTTTTQPATATITPTPEPSDPPTTMPPPQSASRTITISTTPRETYTEVIVTGGGCAGERYGVTLEIRDSTGEPVDGDGVATTPAGSWQLEQRWGADRPAGRYSFHAKCIHSPEEGGQTTVFGYEPATLDWPGHAAG